ncbi:hypothetical protein RBG61_01490 [Paludicola sp. MB14-C6]|uniref:hypothetical protein n=1 Tax=Paludihabitans sp. MB14-C6 TaxID=3070656 RepID=UPI0027DDA142|nr:hypothetical protein [Paludicola sp. MB14-C6]WMJ23363.1 hypothetical protein RBG61_01490 [Paludicola sp. MB14-C6]
MSKIKLFTLSFDISYKGLYETSTELKIKYPSAQLSDYAYVSQSKSYWYWSTAFNDWVNQETSEAIYITLNPQQKAAVPYIVGV